MPRGGCSSGVSPSNIAIQQPIARHHGDVLFPVHRIGDGAHRNGSAQNRFPKLLAGIGVVSAEAAIQIALEEQVAGGDEQRRHRKATRPTLMR